MVDEESENKSSNLEQRIEELEDMVMVEDLGIEEMKKTTKELKAKLFDIVQDLNNKIEKLNDFEGRLKNLSSTEKMDNSNSQMPSNLQESIKDFDDKVKMISEMKQEFDLNISELNNKMDKIKGGKVDIEGPLTVFKMELADILNKLSLIENRLSFLEKSFQDNRSYQPTIIE